ncbi:DUF559 domain-containing protein [Conexibacter sp. CPCC 206217]|uniref:DUF559 domain-containing protein n=1 Tax=Conexibacter sp. CPCC 206217 TaxID=3064574 RepID=UPI00271BF34E|nr:DUF559 domain-containing protein [Conexibacter sp. CPCC 206217]MDO8209967.1 DUF559 domain-containing protein [Conexibacter sp. CPCC 206217]
MPPLPLEDRRITAAVQQQTVGPIDRDIAKLADRQHGVVARRQLDALGVTPSMVAVRLDRRRLLKLHRGVYAVGHARLTRQGEWLAAVLAAGPGAVLSHRSAAALHGLRGERGRRVDVATAANRVSTHRIEVHRRQLLPDADVTARAGIPVTTVSRTLVDLAELLGPRPLARAINEADVLGMLDLDDVLAATGRLRGRRGRGRGMIVATLERHLGPDLLRSELEHRFRELLIDHALPRAEHNVHIGRWEVDACWRPQRLIVELDSRFHDTPAARRQDAVKERALRAAGWHVVRYRWRDVVGAPRRTADELRGVLH